MSQEKTLIIITPGFPSSESDSTCLPSPQTFIHALNRNFPEVKIIAISLQYPCHTDNYSWFNNLVIPLNGKRIPLLFRPWVWIKAWLQLRKIHHQTQILGILSLWCLETSLIGTYFARKKKLKHFTWIHGQDARKKNRLVPLINPSAENLIALSDFLADEFQRNHSIRPKHIIPNGIDASLFTDVNTGREIDIVGVGSLTALKQYTIFISVLGDLVKIKPDVKAVLIGSGPEEIKLRDQISALHLDKNIIVMGEITHTEVLSVMQQSKILLHPSSYEGYSTVCMEALYAGCQVISFTAAEKKEIDHWHIVHSKNEMTGLCMNLLTQRTNFTSVMVHDMNESAKKMMELFGHQAP